MREILFRGKRTDNGEWAYGVPVEVDGYVEMYWFNSEEQKIEHTLMNPETVGEYTGLIDKNGNRIFEGDIIRVDDTENAVVEYDETSAFYMAVFDRAESDFGSLIEQYPNVEIIGNIHDNPELWKGETK